MDLFDISVRLNKPIVTLGSDDVRVPVAGEGFVGREVELAELERGLRAARDGDGGLVLVDGEPGMGKTALAHELSRRAERDGVRTCWGACLEGEGAPPYRPWTQILASLGASLHLDAESRFHAFDEAVALLLAAATETGLLLVLDDLHWADLPSVRLLQELAARLAGSRLLVIGLYRGTELGDLTQPVSALLRERTADRMVLAGLADDDLERLAVRILHRAPGDGLLPRAEGNPLFVLELARFAAGPGAEGHVLPAGVREVIGRRLDRLPEGTRRVLRQASVLGREFSLDQLAAIADLPRSDAGALLDAATAADLVIDTRPLRFAHVLVQEVAYAELSTADRQRLHRRAAEVIGEHLVDARAHHLRQAGAPSAVDATLRAARRATSQLAFEHAASQYRQALQLPEVGADRGQVLLELARCQFRSGAVADAWSSCRAAADAGRAAGDATLVGEAATVVRGLTNDPIVEEIHALCREALTLVGNADPVLRARLLGQLAVTANRWAGVGPGLATGALRAAEEVGDPDALFLALQASHAENVDFRNASERLALGERAVQLGADTGRDDCTAWGHSWRLDAFWQLSRRIQMDTERAALTAVVGHLKEPLQLWRLTMIQASFAMLEGRYPDAEAAADQALAIGRRGGHQEAEFIDVVFRSHLAPLTGDTERMAMVERFVRRFAEANVLARFWHVTVLADLGKLDEAAAVWTTVLPHLAAFPRDTPEWIINQTSTADLAVRLNRPDVARTVYADLEPFAEQQAMTVAHLPSRGPVARYLGMLARLLGDAEAAEKHLITALHLATTMGAAPDEACIRVELARLLLARRGPGDPDQAEAHLRRAADLAAVLGMRPLRDTARALLAAQRGDRSTPLSSREEEVAALVAKGLSNRQIASMLHLSERTVETHVRSIFNKLGFDSRARVASWFASLPRD